MKNVIKKTVKYFRELSIVIIGVAITLYVGNLVGTMKEQRNLNLQLTAIAAELEFNLARVDDIIDFYERHNHLQQSIIENIDNPQQVNDSINKPNSGIGSISSFIYKKGAYELFINSGAIHLLADRSLLWNITESYVWLELTKESAQQYFDAKMQAFFNLYNVNTKMLMGEVDVTAPQWRSMVNFHVVVSGFERSPKEAKEQIEKTLPLLNGKR
jgi:hypothetical protein